MAPSSASGSSAMRSGSGPVAARGSRPGGGAWLAARRLRVATEEKKVGEETRSCG
jgi:hypothetical protein